MLVLGAALAASSTATLTAVHAVALELRARRDVLCARYAAWSGLNLGRTGYDSRQAAAFVSSNVTSLAVERVVRGPAWCVLRATARCGDATRTLERRIADGCA